MREKTEVNNKINNQLNLFNSELSCRSRQDIEFRRPFQKSGYHEHTWTFFFVLVCGITSLVLPHSLGLGSDIVLLQNPVAKRAKESVNARALI